VNLATMPDIGGHRVYFPCAVNPRLTATSSIKTELKVRMWMVLCILATKDAVCGLEFPTVFTLYSHLVHYW